MRLATFLLFLVLAPVATGQTVARSQQNQLNEQQIIHPPSQLGAGEAFLTTMIVDPSITSATYEVDTLNDPNIRSTKLPLQHLYELSDSNWLIVSRVNMGYLDINQTAIDTPWGGSFKPSWQGASLTVGGGVKLPINSHWSVTPTMDIGVAKFRNKTSFYGEFEQDQLQPIFDQYVTNWKSQASVASAALALDYERKFGKTEVDTRLLYAFSQVKTYRESSNLRSFSEQVDSAAVRVNIKHPLGVALFNYPLSGIVHLGASSFVGGDRNALGFNTYTELGGSLVFDISRHDWAVESFSLGAKGLYGDNIRGWALLIDYNI